MTVSGVPNIRVILREADDENLLVDVPNLTVKVIQDSSYNVNTTQPVTVTFFSGSYNRFADVALLAYTASYVSSSDFANTATSASYALTASYAQNVTQNFSGSVSVTGSFNVSGAISASSITGSFKGDGSQLTGLVTDLRISGSTGSDTLNLLTDDLLITGSNGIEVVVSSNTVTIEVPTGLTASLYGTASVAAGIDVVIAGIFETGSAGFIIPAPSGGLSYITSASYALSASWSPTINGIYSSSAQISQSGFVSSSTINIIQTITSASYAAITPVSGTLYIIID